jgi:hypothetical protein
VGIWLNVLRKIVPFLLVFSGMPFDSDQCRIIQKEAKTHWRSIYVASALSFVGAVQFSLYFAALWPYMRKIDHDITESFFGVTVALYSFGQVISAPSFGIWSNRVSKLGAIPSSNLV